MKPWWVVVAIAIVGGLLAATPSTAHAAGERATRVTIQELEPMVVGSRVEAIIELRLADGTPVVDEPVVLTLDGEHVRRSRTKEGGVTSIRLPPDLAPGEYRLEASYEGRQDAYLPSSATRMLEVVPFDLTIQTVPPIPGMVFALDGERFVADDEGVARIAVRTAGDHTLIVLEAEFKSDGDLRTEFSRWNTELFGPEITVRIPNDRVLQAGFDLFRQASQSFVDLDGQPVDPERVTSITLHSSLGNVYEYADGRPRWLKASRSVRRPNGLESVDVRYNVEVVEVDGSNVVNAGQQRFYVDPRDEWEIQLLLFSARVVARDALFGFRAGTTVEVTYPSGRRTLVEADADGEIAIPWLARGLYRMKVANAFGWAPVVPVALSRDQEVELRVVTYVDMAVAVIALSGIALGLLHWGRPHLIPGTVRGAVRHATPVITVPRRVVGAARSRVDGVRAARRRASAAAALQRTARAIGIRPLAGARATLAYPAPVSAAGAVIAVSIGRGTSSGGSAALHDRPASPRPRGVRRKRTSAVTTARETTVAKRRSTIAATAASKSSAKVTHAKPSAQTLDPKPQALTAAGSSTAAAKSVTSATTKAGAKATPKAATRTPKAATKATGATTRVTAAPKRTATAAEPETAGTKTTAPRVGVKPATQATTKAGAKAPPKTVAKTTGAVARAKIPRTTTAPEPGTAKARATAASVDAGGRGASRRAPTEPAKPKRAPTKATTKEAARTLVKGTAASPPKPNAAVAAKRSVKRTGSPPPREASAGAVRSRRTGTAHAQQSSPRVGRPRSVAGTADRGRAAATADTTRGSRRQFASERHERHAVRRSVEADAVLDAIGQVMQRRRDAGAASDAGYRRLDRRLLRDEQLESLGIDDPGDEPPVDLRGPLRIPYGSWRRGPSMVESLRACERCGLELWIGAAYCRRCGLIRSGVSTSVRWAELDERLDLRGAGGRGRGRSRVATSDRPVLRAPRRLGKRGGA